MNQKIGLKQKQWLLFEEIYLNIAQKFFIQTHIDYCIKVKYGLSVPALV